MSLAAMLPSFLTRKTLQMDDVRQPLLRDDDEAKREVADIAMGAFVDVFTYRFVPVDPHAAVLRLRDAAEAARLVCGVMDAARERIGRILQSCACVDACVEHAKSALLTMVSRTSSGNTLYVRSCKDIAAAYVMEALLFPFGAGAGATFGAGATTQRAIYFC